MTRLSDTYIHHRPTLMARSALLVITTTLLLSPLAAVAQDKGEKLWIENKKKSRVTTLKSSSYATLSEKVSPSVVNIIVTINLSGDMPEHLSPQTPSQGAMAVGSGFIIHPDGYILTNNHVVENATSIRIRLNDQREFDARVVGTDPRTDVALIKVSEDTNEKFSAIALGNSDSIKVGENVLAIGNPLGLNHTVTSGIISALGRKDLAPGGKILESDFIQTDASINPGNSGGPLISIDGEVIGINTLVNTQGQGIGFAIPINVVKALLPQLKETGYVIRTWLGVRVQRVTPSLAKSFELKQPIGALISEVVDNSPASKAGLMDGDVILSFNGVKIKHSDQLGWLIATGGTKKTVPLELIRNGKTQTIDLQLEAIPDQDPPQIPTQAQNAVKSTAQAIKLDHDIKVKTLDQDLARKVGAREVKGVAIVELGDHAPIKQAGLRKRDVIVEINKLQVNSAEDFLKAIQAASTQDVVRFKVIRSGRTAYMAFEP